jgi:hypothetical protein
MAKWSFQVAKYMYFDYKKGEIHLGACFARGQCVETYFCEIDVRNDEVAKRDVWSPKFAIFSLFRGSRVRKNT